jgi:hypothetical protein
MYRQAFRILILFAMVCSIGPWGGIGSTNSVTSEPVGAAAFEQKADESVALPLDAQTTISADIGQSEAAYHFVAIEDGYTVRAAANGMGIHLSPDSARIETGNLVWDMRLRGWGYGSAQTLICPPALAAMENRVEYRYQGLSEWYVNGPLGVQQGFTIAEPPSPGQSSQLALALNLGELQATLAEDGKGVVVSGANTAQLNYAGLKAYDAHHRPLTAWMETNSQTLLLKVETAGATYPITVDPLARQVKLTASQAKDENFGFSVALSDDGRTALIGAFTAGVDGTLAEGVAYVFYLEKTYGLGDTPSVFEWVYQARLDYGVANDRFGISVALSDDGNVALIGADQVNWGDHANQGVAYVFTRAERVWSYKTRLVPAAETSASNDGFGWSVALNAAGDTALIGAYGVDTAYTNNGAAYVFTSTAGVWSQQAKLDRAIGADAELGYSVALDDAGDTALLGAYTATWGGRAEQGFASVFQRSGSTWTIQDSFTQTAPLAGDHFGRSVALSASGAVALIGAFGVNDDQGAAYIFTPSGSTWTQKAMLTASDGAAGDLFGVSVAIDGFNAYVGAYKADVSGRADQGAVYRFNQMGAITNWPQQRKFTAYDGAAGDLFGVSVASGSSTLLIGARWANVNGNPKQGAAYTYLPGPGGAGDELKLKLTGCGGEEDYFGESVALSDDGKIALIGAPFADVDGSVQQGAAFIFVHSGSTWTQSARLVATDGGVSDAFGRSVALSGDGHIALVGAPWHNGSGNNQGAAYMFDHTGAVWSQSNWSQLRKITDPEPLSEEYFGASVALSDDGNTVLVGAPNASVLSKTNNGLAIFYHYNPSATPEVFTGGINGELFGKAVALSGDGLTALIGRPGATTDGDAKRGSADVYAFDSHNWVKQKTLSSTYGEPNNGFGAQLALSDDGNIALVGVPLRTVTGNAEQGAAYIFTRTGSSTWSASHTLLASVGHAGDQFGSSVALNANGTVALIGATKSSGDGPTAAGAAYSFTREGNSWTQRRILYGQDNDNNSWYGYSSALSDNGWTGLSGAIGGGGYGQGAAYVIPNPAGVQTFLPFVKK